MFINKFVKDKDKWYSVFIHLWSVHGALSVYC